MKDYIKNNLEAILSFITLLCAVVAWGIFGGIFVGDINAKIMTLRDNFSSLVVKEDARANQTEKQLAVIQAEVALIKKAYLTQNHFYHNSDMAWAAIDRIRKSLTIAIAQVAANKAKIEMLNYHQ